MVHELTKREPAMSRRDRAVAAWSLDPHGFETTQPHPEEMLATVAHELRGPLANTISGMRVIGAESDLSPFTRTILARMEHQLCQSMRLVDDLFDLCAGGLDKLSLRKEVVVLNDVVVKATETAGELLAARQHRLTVSLLPETLTLKADPLRLSQVLTNLLCNAAKFTDPGGHIQLTAADEDGQIVLRVRDNGRGIAPDLLPQVFDLYQQSPGRAAGGLGIGLALVKTLVELHGGTVTARSDGPGAGAEFIVRLPVCAADRADCEPLAKQPDA